MQTISGRIITALLAIAFLVSVVILAHQQKGGPPHLDFALHGGEPATLYLPGSGDFYRTLSITPRAAADRPPAVVLCHGYSSDRLGVSKLARLLAGNGYAVLAIDFHGHGANRNPFSDSFGQRDILYDDIREAVDYLRSAQLVDPARIVVMGHSMGAGASLDYATQDANLAGSVMISGGWSLWGPLRPRNALFIFAERDPEFIRDPSIAIASHLAGVERVELGKRYGDPASGTAVEAVQVPGVDHVQIIVSDQAAQTIIQWLDSVDGISRNREITLRDPRRRTTAIALLLFLVLLIPLGRICGGLSPAWPRREAGSAGWLGLGVLAIALSAAIPLVAVAPPADFLSVQVANQIFSWLALAGTLLTLWLVLRNALEWPRIKDGISSTILAAVLSFAFIYIAMASTSATIHRLVFTPERLIATAIAAVLLLPFFFSFEQLVRRGGVAISTTLAVIGRALIVILIAVGVWLGVLPQVVSLMVGLFIIMFVMFEIFAASVYSASGNLTLIALVESAWMAWLVCVLMPIMISI